MRLDANTSEHVLADSEELLCGFAGTQRKATRCLGYVPILDISW